MMVQTNPFAAL